MGALCIASQGAWLVDGQTVRVKFVVGYLEGSKGARDSFVVDIHDDWDPIAAKRFLDLVAADAWKTSMVYHATDAVIKWGIPAKPEVSRKLKNAVGQTITPLPTTGQPHKDGHKRGILSFVQGADSGGVEIAINRRDREKKDISDFVAIGEVVEGMETCIDKINTEYGLQPDIEKVWANG